MLPQSTFLARALCARRPAPDLQPFHAIALKRCFVDIQAKPWMLRHHAFAVLIAEGLLAVQKRQEGRAIVVGEMSDAS
jgi:hypothetical protein